MAKRIGDHRPARTLCLALFCGLAGAILVGPLATPAQADEHGRGYGGRQEHRHYEYRQRPEVYYGPPPIVYAPPGYYQQPGVSLNFGIPLFR